MEFRKLHLQKSGSLKARWARKPLSFQPCFQPKSLVRSRQTVAPAADEAVVIVSNPWP